MKKIIWLVQFCTALFLAHSAWALNGAQLTGYSAVHEALGGSGVAHPQDFSAILINPAGITQLPRQASFNLLVGFPNSRMNTAASPSL